ncbi:MAG: SDR family NAD(P)-dependent oxidoreductase [Nostoc sp.]|uniref:SDR family NAD(P)-dependent oxidoreductase n=1 Tax=Nostoc sp. TaxID=1180 RepID=UPI002FF9130C
MALVTGSLRSLGAAIAKRLAQDGAAVALTYTSSPEKANEVVFAIKAAGGQALAIGADGFITGASLKIDDSFAA